MKKLLTLLLLFSIAFSCFSISDLSAVEIEIKVNPKPLLSAENVVFSDGAFYLKMGDILVKLSEDRVRIIFPVSKVDVYHCRAYSKELKWKCGAERGERYITWKNGSALFNAYFNGSDWVISLDYESSFPQAVKNCLEPPLNFTCESEKVPKVTKYSKEGVKQAVKNVLVNLKKHGIVNLSDEDIEEIVNVSKLGNAGYNGRIVKFNGTWVPYYRTPNPVLLKGYVTGGCGTGEVIEPPAKDVVFKEQGIIARIISILKKIFRF